MNEYLAKLLEQAAGEDCEHQRHAVLQIAMLLERSTRVAQGELRTEEEPFYAALSPPSLVTYSLTRQEHAGLVEKLTMLVRAGNGTPEMLWAIEKASPDIGIRPLLALLGAYPALLDDEAAYQALIALEDFLVMDNGRLQATIAHAINEHPPLPTLERMRDGSVARLARQAASVLASLERKLPPR